MTNFKRLLLASIVLVASVFMPISHIVADIGIGVAKNTRDNFVLGAVFGIKEVKKFDLIPPLDNVQTLSLLQAPKNIDPMASVDNKLVVIDDSAITNEHTGVDGTLAVSADFKPLSDQISLYTVRAGDTLSDIATMYDVTPNTIRLANDIGPKEAIVPGQVLVVLPITGLRYTTKKGDTLASIAKSAGVGIDDIASFNDLSTNGTLAVNTTIIIPDTDSEFGPGHNDSVTNSKLASVNIKAQTKTVKKTSGSGYYACPINATRTQGLHGHNGVDYGAPIGTSIIAAADGEVMISRTGWNGGYGTYIVIKHANGTQTLYGHMSQLLVSPGERVVKGQVIGKMGNTGQSTGPHVHFEVRGATNPC